MPGLGTQSSESGAFVNTARTSIHFDSDRPGGKGKADIWRASRASPGAAYANLAPVVELNSTGDDTDIWLSPDGKVAVFASTRSGAGDLYFCTR